MSEPNSAPRTFPYAAKWVVSLLILAHFFAIGTAITSVPTLGSPPPAVTMGAYEGIVPYLRLVALTNAYRFYSPNPGPTYVLWFRVRYQDKSVRWVEFPRREDYALRMPYQRRLAISMLLESETYPDLQMPNLRRLTPVGEAILSSYIRKVARIYHQDQRADGAPEANPVAEVQVYYVGHGVLSPEMVRANVEATDLRMYACFYLGAYAPDGASKSPKGTEALRSLLMGPPGREMFMLTARIIENDVRPQLDRAGAENLPAVLERLDVPTPVRRFLTKYPHVVDGTSTAEIANQVGRVVDSAGPKTNPNEVVPRP